MSDRMIGQVFGKFRVTRRIGEGGVGAVYEAKHVELDRRAAVKILLPAWSNNDVVVKRFFNEAVSSSRANHPGIVDIFDYGKADNGRHFLIMEFLHGEPLSRTLLRDNPLPIHRMTSISRQIAGALAAAHHKGVIHRDLKPDNIFIIPDKRAQTGERIKVLDFGVAKLSTTKHVNTFVGVMLGTPLYMSPEQCISSREVDGRSDIYSLGCIMFEMVCGRPPYVHAEASSLAMMHVEEPIPRPRTLRTDIPANVESLILRTLAKDPDHRPQSMGDLRAELDIVWSLLPAADRALAQLATPAPGVPVVRVLPSSAKSEGSQARELPAAPPGAASHGPAPLGDPLELISPLPPGHTVDDAPERDERERWRLLLVTTVVMLVVLAGAIAMLLLSDLLP